RSGSLPEMRPNVVVVIPARDEEATIGDVVRAVPRPPVDHVVVVDNGSTDATSARAMAGGAVVVHEPRRGYGAACLRGLEAARAAGAEVVCLMDADGSDAPEQLARLLALLERGDADVILGIRDSKLAEPGALTPQQRFGNALAVWLMRVFV